MSNRKHEKKVIKLTKKILTQRSEDGQTRRAISMSGTNPRKDSNVWDGIAGKQFHAPRATDNRVKGQTVIKPVTLTDPSGKKVAVSRRLYKCMRKAGVFKKANQPA